ncbi:MAG: hypothetical protein BroJett026_39740 [Betaproteobacteria bacterium]|nr:MAG: hypothetical protein BroJett026_39740 [Betaproteobacteria bacterium]
MIDLDDLRGLLASGARPCVSLYQPTHRRHPENQQDPIRFRNLVKEAEVSLAHGHAAATIGPLLEPFRELAGDAGFWNHTTDGLAVFGAPGLFRIVRLQRPMPERLVVADSFHVKPMLRVLQSADRYQVLAVNRREIRLFEGNRDVLDEIDLAPGVPRTITDALGEELTDKQMQVHSYGTGPAGGAGGRRQPGGEKSGGIRHGSGSKKDEVDRDTERFFREVDRAVHERHSKPGGLPLILAGLGEHHAPFRSVSRNPFLVDGGIAVNTDALAPDDLRRRAWEVMEPHYVARLEQLVERFGAARAAGQGNDRLADVARAAAAGRVATLLLAAGRVVPGRFDRTTGEIEQRNLGRPDVDDVLDDLAEHVLRTGGEVVVSPEERMPSTTGLAAIYRY